MKKYLILLAVLLFAVSGCSSSSSQEKSDVQNEPSQQSSEVTQENESSNYLIDTYHELQYIVLSQWETIDTGKDQKTYVCYAEDETTILFMLTFTLIEDSDPDMESLYELMQTAAQFNEGYQDIGYITNENDIDFVTYNCYFDDMLAVSGDTIIKDHHYMITIMTDPLLKDSILPLFEMLLNSISTTED